MKDMEQSMAKLHALSADDKTEAAMLRGRIDEQSHLIMILKKRSDDAVIRCRTLDKINKDLMEFRENANEQLRNEVRKSTMLDQRFNELAYNHEEMIKFKDEYKRRNADLKDENAKLKDENGRLFCQAITERDQLIENLEQKCSDLKSEYATIEQKNRQLQQELKHKEEQYQGDIQRLKESNRSQVAALQNKLHDAEERLKGTSCKLQQQLDSRQSEHAESTDKISQLSREKDELLDLAMKRGKLITKEQMENKILQRKAEEMEKVVKKMEEKFKLEASAVNANMQVRKLRDDLSDANIKYEDVIKEFGAFKKHTANLLQKERELNERLRHLVG